MKVTQKATHISPSALMSSFIKAQSIIALLAVATSAHAFNVEDGKKQAQINTQEATTPDQLATQTAQNGNNEQTPQETTETAEPSTPICAPDALAVGIEHFFYEEVFAEDLVWSGYGSAKEENKLIHKDVKQPLQTLVKAAAKDKVALYPSSIFRSVKAQDTIIKRKIRQKQNSKTIYHTSSPAGYSEHHTGYAVDFAPIEAKFAKTKGYQWLIKHAHEYGWEQTFHAEYAAKSGVSEESWHWRYVGDERGKSLFAQRTCQPYEPIQTSEDTKIPEQDKATDTKQTASSNSKSTNKANKPKANQQPTNSTQKSTQKSTAKTTTGKPKTKSNNKNQSKSK